METETQAEIKYCPKCLGICEISKYAGIEMAGDWKYGCYRCEVLLYSPAVLLDTPDKDKSINYQLGEVLKGYNLSEETRNYLIEEIRKIF